MATTGKRWVVCEVKAIWMRQSETMRPSLNACISILVHLSQGCTGFVEGYADGARTSCAMCRDLYGSLLPEVCARVSHALSGVRRWQILYFIHEQGQLHSKIRETRFSKYPMAQAMPEPCDFELQLHFHTILSIGGCKLAHNLWTGRYYNFSIVLGYASQLLMKAWNSWLWAVWLGIVQIALQVYTFYNNRSVMSEVIDSHDEGYALHCRRTFYAVKCWFWGPEKLETGPWHRKHLGTVMQ